MILASSKKALEWALSMGWIESAKESVWLGMMSDRNLTSHTYREQTAQEVVNRVLGGCVAELVSILRGMKDRDGG